MNTISSSAKAGFGGSAGGVDNPAGRSQQRKVGKAKDKKRALSTATANTEEQPTNRKVARLSQQKPAVVMTKTSDNISLASSKISPKAFPLSPPHLAVEIFSLLNQAQSHKKVKRGANEVAKALNRQNALLVILAADIQPIEFVLPLTRLSEEKNVPYVFVDGRHQLGRSVDIERPVAACCITHDTILYPTTQSIISKVDKLLI